MTVMRRLGVLVPASDPIVEADFRNYLPNDISFHVSRLYQAPASAAATVDTLTLMTDSAEACAQQVSQVDPELIVFACTSGSLFKGFGWDKELAAKITKAAGGIPATTTATSMVEAHKALGLRKVVMVTPYPEKTNKIEVEFLKANGVDVVEFASFDCAKSRDIDKIPTDKIKAKVLEHRATIKKTDGVFISCTALRSIGAVESLERELGVPVVTSNQSTLWNVLRLMGVDSSGIPCGRLFRLPQDKKARVA